MNHITYTAVGENYSLFSFVHYNICFCCNNLKLLNVANEILYYYSSGKEIFKYIVSEMYGLGKC